MGDAFGASGVATLNTIPREWPGETVVASTLVWSVRQMARITIERDGEVPDCRDRRTMQPNFQVWRRGNGEKLLVNAIYKYVDAARIADAWLTDVVRSGPDA